MATVTLYDFYDFSSNDGNGWSISGSNATTINLSDSSHQKTITFSGSFTQSGNSISGTVNGLSLSQNGTSIFTISGLNLDAATTQSKFLGDNQAFKSWLLSGDDTFIVNTKAMGGTMNGYGGSDTLVFAAPRGDYAESVNIVGPTFKPTMGSGSSGQLAKENMSQIVSVQNIETIRFSDSAIRLDSGGNSAKTMEFIGTVAPSLLNDLAVRREILKFFDSGYSMESLCQLALNAKLVPTTNEALAAAVFQNVVGSAAPAGTVKALVDYIDTHSQANFLATVAEMHLNVDVVGIAQSGMSYAL
ncbi:MAG: hypothetical protein D3M94_09250 [Rhodocyclales bacterium GT-UBC]|nr:MAG: hypothetical protein D3M94_09250 [Rhodocyclales bacterium GT-UBC]